MIAGTGGLVALFGFAIVSRGSPEACGDPIVGASLVSGTLLTFGAPMIELGRRACQSVWVGTAPIWATMLASWGLAGLSAGGCSGIWPQLAIPVEVMLALPLGFIGPSLGVFQHGIWCLIRAKNPQHPG